MNPTPVIIDCDTGVDDAMALLLALRSPALEVRGITCVAGNALIENVVRNTLVVVDHAEVEVPVMSGAVRPLMGSWEVAVNAHGSDGLGDVGFPEPQARVSDEHAVDYLVRAFMEADEPLDLITLAPLTNVALALLREPELERRIHRLVMMAGGITGGNVTPAAEFNVWVDPEAADIVFRSQVPKVMVGLEPIRDGGNLYAEDVDRLEGCEAPWCEMMSRLLRSRLQAWEQIAGRPMPTSPPDLSAMGVAIDPTIAQSELYHVMVETQGIYTRGMTLVDNRWYRDLLRESEEPNVEVVTAMDNDRFRALVLETLIG